MRKILICSMVAIGVAGCASTPIGPRVTVMPAPGKPFEVFVEEDHICRHFAAQSIGTSPDDSATRSMVGSAAVGTLIGATAGALSGGNEGGGAAAGLVVGTMAGAGQGSYSSRDTQRRYDIAYEQCMYAKGNQIPGYASSTRYVPPPAPAAPPNAAPYPPPR